MEKLLATGRCKLQVIVYSQARFSLNLDADARNRSVLTSTNFTTPSTQVHFFLGQSPATF